MQAEPQTGHRRAGPFATRLNNRLARLVPINPVRSKLAAPIASISFDDIPRSAATRGAPILEAAGVRGTFYVCGAHTDATFEDRPQHARADLKALHAAGHELACHTFAHPEVTMLNDDARQADHVASLAFFRETVGDVIPGSFAYPYGSVSPGAKAFYGRHFLTCRSVRVGVNAGWMDFADLDGIGIEVRNFDIGRIKALIEEAAARKGWLIFFTHDVTEVPTPYGCRPDQLEAVIAALQEARIEVAPVKAAAARVMFG